MLYCIIMNTTDEPTTFYAWCRYQSIYYWSGADSNIRWYDFHFVCKKAMTLEKPELKIRVVSEAAFRTYWIDQLSGRDFKPLTV